MREDSMKKVIIAGLACALAGLLPVAWAQDRPAASPAESSHASPRPEDLEPGVDTSAADRDTEVPAPARGAVPVAEKPRTTAASGNHASAAKPDARTASGGKPGAAKADGKPGAGKADDRLQLDATEITGNRELPKVMYIVPWKRADLGELASKPMNSLVDEVLEPIDRDVFQRQTRYYDALKPDQAHPADSVPAAPAGAGSH
jgi:hypothetical protein